MRQPRSHRADCRELLRHLRAARKLALLRVQAHLPEGLLESQEQIRRGARLDEIRECPSADRRDSRFQGRESSEQDDRRLR